MKKALKKLIPTIIMVLIAASMVGTSTFAWFSMNSKVTVTGMTVTTKVDNNLAIAEFNNDLTAFKNTLAQTRSGQLRPSSTVNGLTYYYTNPSNVLGNGDAKLNEYVLYDEDTSLSNGNAGKSNYDDDFVAAYGITSVEVSTVAYGYIDYEFYIQATNVAGSATYLRMTGCNLMYNGQALNSAVGTADRAWRVAVFAAQATKGSNYTTDWATGDRKAILTPASAANFTSGEAVNSETTTGSVTYNSANTWYLDEIASKQTEYVKVLVRLWLEGEDNTCNNDTYANLTAAYTLDLAFELSTPDNSVVNIGSLAIVTSTVSGNTVSVDQTSNVLSSNSKTAKTYQWYSVNASGVVSQIDGATAASYEVEATGNYYCVITCTDNSVVRTATQAVTYTPAP